MFSVKTILDKVSEWEGLMDQKKNTNAKTIDSPLADALKEYSAAFTAADFERVHTELYERQESNREALGIKAPLGLTAVMGPGHSGKTTWLRNLYKNADQTRVKYIVTGEVGGFFPYSFTGALAQLNTDACHVLLVDSWKDIWNDWHFSNGTLQSGGINTAFTAYLGLLSQCLFLAGKTLIVILNPQTAGEKESVYQMVNSQCSGMIRLSGATPGQADYAEGRVIHPEYDGEDRLTGITVVRDNILADDTAIGSNPMSALFSKPIL